MQKIKNVAFVFFLSILMLGCETGKQIKVLSPLQIQEIQTREFEEDKKIVFASVISTFLNLGYTINNADLDTGLISAESPAKSNKYISLVLGTTEVTQTKASAFVEKIGNYTRVRLNFVNIVLSSSEQGQSDRNDTRVLNNQSYQSAFNLIETAIFIRVNN